jgi:MFS family permease
VLGRLADAYGKRRILLVALTAMSLGALTSAIATTLPVMVAGRVVQGLGGAAGTITAGPVLTLLSSRWLFLIPALVSALAIIPVLLLLPPARPIAGETTIDWYGAALLSTWLGLLLFAISRFPDSGWSWPLTGVAVLAPLWWRSQRRAARPLIDLRTLALPTVRATNAATLLLGFGMFGSWMVIPLLIVDRFAVTPTVVGLAMLPTAIGNLLIMPVHKRLTARQGPRAALAAGISAAGLSYVGLALRHDTLLQVCIGILVMGAGVGLAFSAVGALVVEAVPSEQTGVSAAVNTVMRMVGGSLGTAVGGSVLTRSPAYVTVLLLYAAALAGALLCAVQVPRPVTVAGEPAAAPTGTA